MGPAPLWQTPPLAGMMVAGVGCGGSTQLDNSKHIPPANIPVTLTLGESAPHCTAHPHPYASGSSPGKLAS